MMVENIDLKDDELIFTVQEETNKKSVIEKIVDNYTSLEKSIIEQLNFSNPNHHGITGSHREFVWRELFERLIPKKFAIEESVFIIDSKEGLSREVDLVIFDETYTPYIFRFGHLKFIPIEAVAVVVECKSANILTKEKKKKDADADAIYVLEKWANRIDDLQTGDGAIVRTLSKVTTGIGTGDQTQTSTRPIKILCHTKSVENIEGATETVYKCFDFVIAAANGRLNVWEHDDIKELSKAYEALNHHKSNEQRISKIADIGKLSAYEVKKKNGEKGEVVSIISLMFKLNQLLMLINNPIFFPHKAYVEMFKTYLGTNEVGGKENA